MFVSSVDGGIDSTNVCLKKSDVAPISSDCLVNSWYEGAESKISESKFNKLKRSIDMLTNTLYGKDSI